jgi:hypothetical protein
MAARFRAGEVENWGSDLQKVVNGTCGNFKTAQKFAKKDKNKTNVIYVYFCKKIGC